MKKILFISYLICSCHFLFAQTVTTICEGENTTLTATSTGDSYQWLKDGNPISGATGKTLTLNNVGAGDAAGYTCEVTTEGTTDDTGNLIPFGDFEFDDISDAYGLLGHGGNEEMVQYMDNSGITLTALAFGKHNLHYEAGNLTGELTTGATMIWTDPYDLKTSGGPGGSWFTHLDDYTLADGTGTMLIVDGSATGAVVWRAEGVQLTGGKDYEFSCEFANIDAQYGTSSEHAIYNEDGDSIGVTTSHHNSSTLPKLTFRFTPTGGSTQNLPTHTVSETLREWTPYSETYNAPSTGTYTIELFNSTDGTEGNDFAVDDIYIGTVRSTSPITVIDSYTLNVDLIPGVTVPNETACPNTAKNLLANITGTTTSISWTKGSTVLNGENHNYLEATSPTNASDADTYTISVTNGACTTPQTASATLTAIDCGNTISRTMNPCEGTAFDVTTETTGTAYNWLGQTETSNTLHVDVAIAATYTCEVTTPTGTITEIITVNPIDCSIPIDTIKICLGDITTLNTGDTNTYDNLTWSGDDPASLLTLLDDTDSPSPTFTPTAIGTYSYTFEGTETKKKYVIIVEDCSQTKIINNTTTICESNDNPTSDVLTARSGGTDYLWDSGETTQSLDIELVNSTDETIVSQTYKCTYQKGDTTIIENFAVFMNPILHSTVYGTTCQGYPYSDANETFNISASETQTSGILRDTTILTQTEIDPTTSFPKGCDSIVTLTLTVLPTVYNTTLGTTCQGEAYNDGTFSIPSSETQLPGLITAIDTLSHPVTGCDSIVTLELTINPLKSATIPDEVCQGDGYHRNNFTLDPSETTVGDSILTRTRTISSVAGCDSTITLELMVNENPRITQVITEGRNAEILTEGGSLPFDYVIDEYDFYASNIITGLSIGNHSILITDDKTCKVEGEFEIDPEPIIPKKYMSPNGDGINDRWVVKNIEFYPEAIIIIFDRFHKEIIRYTGADEGWDGIYRGHPCRATDYWYLINIEEINKTYSGHFTLKR